MTPSLVIIGFGPLDSSFFCESLIVETALEFHISQVVAEHLSVEEVAGIKELFGKMDINNKGRITLEELKVGLQKIGQHLPDPDLQILMEAVSMQSFSFPLILLCKFEKV